MTHVRRTTRWMFLFVMVGMLAVLTACDSLSGSVTAAPDEPAATPEAADPTTAPTAEPTAEPTDAPAEPAAEPTIEPTSEPTRLAARTIEDCPEAGEGTLAYVNEAAGFCFLYPDTLTAEEGYRREYEVDLGGVRLGEDQDPNNPHEPLPLMMTVSFNGPSLGMTAAEYEARTTALVGYPPSVEQTPTETVANGFPAVTNLLPIGMTVNRTAYIVAGDYRYNVMVFPDPPEAGEHEAVVEAAWNTVMDSIVFFEPTSPPPYTDAADVCPQAADGTELHVNDLGGFCFLIPEGSELNTEYSGPNTVAIGASMTISSRFEGGAANGDGGDDTTRPYVWVAAQMERDQPLDLDTSSEVNFDANADVKANGMVYYISRGPLDEDGSPDGTAWLDDAWETVTSSIQFFTPWR